jgi:hypothetical protein
VEFAKANAMRPRIVGEALQKIGQDPEVSQTMFEILETERMIASHSQVTFLPKGHPLLSQMLASSQSPGPDGERSSQVIGSRQ